MLKGLFSNLNDNTDTEYQASNPHFDNIPDYKVSVIHFLCFKVTV